MKKIIVLIAAVAATVLCLSSCNGIHTGTYTFDTMFHGKATMTQETVQELVDYMKTIEYFKHSHVYEGEFTDVSAKAMSEFSKAIQSVDVEFVKSKLGTDGEFSVLLMYNESNVLAISTFTPDKPVTVQQM